MKRGRRHRLPHHEWRRISVSHRMSRHQTWNGSSERRVHDSNRGAGSYDVVQLYDVARAHSNASIARRRSDTPFLRRAVNVNISGERVGILSLQSAQPENACDDGVAAGGIRGNDFAGAEPILEHCTGRRIVADFFGDLQFAQWRKTAAAPIP